MENPLLDELRAEVGKLRAAIDELDVVEAFIKMVGEKQENGDIVVPGDALQIVSSTFDIFSKAKDLLVAIELYFIDKKAAYLIYNKAIFDIPMIPKDDEKKREDLIVSDKIILEDVPLFEYIVREEREWIGSQMTPEPRAPSIVARRTRGIKWFLNGVYSGAWVYCVDDETDFDKLATALYVARRIRKSKFWAWWYRTFYRIQHYLVGAGITGNEWPENLK